MNELDKTTKMLQRRAEGAPERAEAILKAVASELERDIKERAPKKTGKMADSIKVSFPDPLTVQISGNAVMAYQEFGTKPHVILPKNKPYLMFKTKDGKWVRTKRVNHPGTPANPFVRPAVSELLKTLGDKLGRMGAALKEYGNT